MIKQTQIIAAIDIGSNSVHMLLAYKKSEQKLTIIKSYKKILTLGRSLDENLNLSESSIDKICMTLERMKEKAIPYCPYFAIVATHAIRVARNRREVVEIVYKRTKLPIRVIHGKEEARLIGKAICFHFNLQKKNFLGVDIGGGSTEVALFKNGKPIILRTVKLGSVTLTEKFLTTNREDISEDSLNLMIRHVKRELRPIIDALRPLEVDEQVISSGVGKTLASMHYFQRTQRKLKNPDRYVLSTNTVTFFYRRLCRLRQTKKIQSQWKLNPNKAEIVLAGVVVLYLLTQELGVSFWKISNYGIREGLVLDLLNHKSKQP